MFHNRWGRRFATWRSDLVGAIGCFRGRPALTRYRATRPFLSHQLYRIYPEARFLAVLSAPAAVGLEILLHDVNTGKTKPGIVTRVDLHEELATLHALGSQRQYTQDDQDSTQQTDDNAGNECSFYTCRKPLYAGFMIPVPISHSWQWINMNDVELCDEKLLGNGTFADVFRASMAFNASENIDDYVARSVAVKSFYAEKSDIETIAYETDISAYMASIGVGPETYGLLKSSKEAEDTLPSLVTRYIRGSKDLGSLFEKADKPSRDAVVDIFVQTARLLAVIHSHKFLHNDIKCCNILATPTRHDTQQLSVPSPSGITGQYTPHSTYRVYLIDFGQTTYREGAEYNIAEEEILTLGSNPYLPPEVLKGEPTSTASEVYSFGIMLQSSCTLLGDGELESDLVPIIDQCLGASAKTRPTMEDVECWMAALLPPVMHRRHVQHDQLLHGAMIQQRSVSLTDTISDICPSQSWSDIGSLSSSPSISLSSQSSGGFEISVVQDMAEPGNFASMILAHTEAHDLQQTHEDLLIQISEAEVIREAMMKEYDMSLPNNPESLLMLCMNVCPTTSILSPPFECYCQLYKQNAMPGDISLRSNWLNRHPTINLMYNEGVEDMKRLPKPRRHPIPTIYEQDETDIDDMDVLLKFDTVELYDPIHDDNGWRFCVVQ